MLDFHMSNGFSTAFFNKLRFTADMADRLIPDRPADRNAMLIGKA
ncbi:hypothetical protein Clim_1682 [Chlorobium limicola DSM 245]|jgi:hypothetical protein|uniref:Uncharacterized protein n=1 Tax=Chlorobium limicola (strain DSM 245 / NBRC 103803 / 6330) TaxID=290315 RepID=B3EE22_CHLL2|nr:hypothetical protein Clim_1682 [Chlorobium limicola DSM 245]